MRIVYSVCVKAIMLKVSTWLAVVLLHNCAVVNNAGEVCTLHYEFEPMFKNNCLKEGIEESTCDNAWDAFSGAFESRNPKDVTVDDYTGYFDLIPLQVRPSSLISWSDIYPLTDFISDEYDNSVTAPCARIVKNIDSIWCETEDNRPRDVFWAAFSRMLGRLAEGVVYWVTPGERGDGKPLYDPDSSFASHELAAMESPRVRKLVAINVRESGMGETCGEGSLLDLERDVLSKDIAFECAEVLGDLSRNNTQDLQRMADEVHDIIKKAQEQDDSTSMLRIL